MATLRIHFLSDLVLVWTPSINVHSHQPPCLFEPLPQQSPLHSAAAEQHCLSQAVVGVTRTHCPAGAHFPVFLERCGLALPRNWVAFPQHCVLG